MKHQLPSIISDFPEWYQDVIFQAELADHSPVKGAVVIRPYGYAIWEEIKNILDKKIKATGTQNAAFPLFIPLSFLQKEAEHVAGFSPELAIVTHAGGKELEEPYVVRPTSETIIHYMFAQWIKSWRDLPMQINQWANVVRWEMRTRPFLRTSEFFWQEGHTAHETQEQAVAMAERIWDEYADLYENYLAIPVIKGLKSDQEKFAGADRTYTVEGMMQDGKALQLCTSHLISQNFAKSFDMKFQAKDGTLAYPYLTSWGFTTRSVGAVVMVHGDQAGLILPPKIAPIQVVIIPIFSKTSDKQALLSTCKEFQDTFSPDIRVHIDAREEETPGAKFYTWELKGVPLRIELGQRDLQASQVICVNRITKEKTAISFDKLKEFVDQELKEIHKTLFSKAQNHMKKNWHHPDALKEFTQKLEHTGGFYQTGWCKKAACENILKEHKASIRCLLDLTKKTCFNCQEPALTDIIIARSY